MIPAVIPAVIPSVIPAVIPDFSCISTRGPRAWMHGSSWCAPGCARSVGADGHVRGMDCVRAGLSAGMQKTCCDCCVVLCCGALAEVGWRVRWWRVRVPACVDALGGVSMRVRSSRAMQWHTGGGWEYISPTLQSCVAAAYVLEAAGEGRSGAGGVWASAAWCRRSERSDRIGLVWCVRPGWSVRRGVWIGDVAGHKVDGVLRVTILPCTRAAYA